MTNQQMLSIMAMIAYAADNIAGALALRAGETDPAYKSQQDVCDEAVQLAMQMPKVLREQEQAEGSTLNRLQFEAMFDALKNDGGIPCGD